MRSMFVSAPFSRYDLGRHALSRGLGFSRPGLGQNQATVFALEDYLAKIENIADKETRDLLKANYEDCKKKDLESAAGIACLVSLGTDVYAALRNQDEAVPRPPVMAPPPAPASSIPIIPIALAALGAGALIWFLATRGKK